MKRDLHIITLNTPYPPDYGGMIDSYYRIKTLHEKGIGIHLHCFEYGRGHPTELESLCISVSYYGRNTSFSKHLSLIPFTVISRDSEQLAINLAKDKNPILFDGLHTTYLLDYPFFSDRIKIVRMHNIEHHYYVSLSRFEKDPFKKFFYSVESWKLKHYEKILRHADVVLTVSDTDQEYFESKYNNAELLPSFHPYNTIDIIEGTGDYIIYHADLSVNENAIVAGYLINKIFSKIPYKCIIAGKNPPLNIRKSAESYKNIILLADPVEKHMTDLIRNAQVNLLFTIAPVGLKLKLLISLFSGRHCLVNSNIIKGTMLGPACLCADSADDIIRNIGMLMNQPFTARMIDERKSILEPYSSSFNAERLSKLIFPG